MANKSKDGKKREMTSYYLDVECKKYVDDLHKELNPNSENGKPSKANIAEIVFNLGIERDRENRKYGL